jgi:Protein of unknown function (DUF2474)
LIDPRLDLPDGPRTLRARLGWLALIWASSVGALALLAFVIRAWIR